MMKWVVMELLGNYDTTESLGDHKRVSKVSNSFVDRNELVKGNTSTNLA
ncbi:hypothetical protein [Photobacterium angustum]|nr:hypothetical protein [Photobacterium angustum]